MRRSKSTKQMLNAELATRAYNTKAKKIIEKQTPEEERPSLIINFYCECSDIRCRQRIPMTIAEYELLHSKKARFVLAKGHAEPLVEEKIVSNADLTVVEKYAL
jgi:hypothetical protein